MILRERLGMAPGGIASSGKRYLDSSGRGPQLLSAEAAPVRATATAPQVLLVHYVTIALLGLAVVGVAGVAVLLVIIAILSRELPNLPLHARLNPFNILALSSHWTPEIRALHAWAVKFMLVFIASVLAFLATGIITFLRQ
jgi:hypothetical protein